MTRRPSPAVAGLAAAVFGLLVAVGTLPALMPLIPGGELLREGDTAPRTLLAQQAAQYESRALTEAARDAAASRVEPLYLPPDRTIRDRQVEQLGRLIDQVRVIRGRTNLTATQQLEEVGRLSVAEPLSNAGRANLIFLDRAAYETVVQQSQTALGQILEAGVKEGQVTTAVREHLSRSSSVPTELLELTALSELLNAFVVPNVRIDETATQALQAGARSGVASVVASYTAGQVVVNEGDTLTADDIEALRATGLIEPGIDIADTAAGALAAVAFGLAFGFAAWAFQPFARPPYRRLLLTGAVTVATVWAARFALPQVLPDDESHYLVFAIPVATAAMLGAAVGSFAFGTVVAFAVALVVGFAGATMTELPGAAFGGSVESLRIVTTYAAGGFAGAAAMAGAERMRRVAFAAVAVAAATAAVLLLFWLLSVPRTNEELGYIAGASLVNGLASSVLATGLFVLLSLILGIPTRMQLFELAQADHPLLRRLQEEAPGTYHHSLMVGTLAERAAGNIGADALLARVGAYYHDIGKLARPGFFIENMTDPAQTPHEELMAEESAGIIRSHVTDGIEFARRARLPVAVRDFIPQHHGTRLVTFFYRQATHAGAAVDVSSFKYPGPRPETRESAIVMLADSCEAVVRAASDHSPANIDEMVDGVLAERLSEGQFDDCDVTLRELQIVARTFKATFRAIYHPRIEYPRPAPEELAAITGAPLTSSRPDR